jgi:hypothetical protein
VLRDDDASLKSEAFAQLLLPELYSLWIFKWRESVIEDYLGDGWRMLIHPLIVNGNKAGHLPVEDS